VGFTRATGNISPRYRGCAEVTGAWSNDANDVVDDARSGIECAKGVIVEQRIT